MKVRKWLWVAPLVLMLAAYFATGIVNPLRRSDAGVHDWLLNKVPVGSDLIALQSTATREGWQLKGSWAGHQLNSGWGGIDGDTVAWVYLGHYQSILSTDLDSFWAFDKNGALVDVRIRRMVDSL